MKAVIQVNGHQYIVEKNDEISTSQIDSEKKSLSAEPLLIFEDEKITVGTPVVDGAKVTLDVKEHYLGDKTLAIRYKAKKRVNKIRGHRQKRTSLVVKSISTKASK